MAVLEYILDAQGDEWTALAGREFVAERCPLAWPLGPRLTREEREERPLTPGNHPRPGPSH